MPGKLAKLYYQCVALGEIEMSLEQLVVVSKLEALTSALENRTSGLPGFMRRRRPEPCHGLYLHGGVGRGKTMLMDMFLEAIEHPAKRRLHFHEFMSEVHDRIKRGRDTTEGDPIPFVASEIAAEADLLCLDELQVTDIADAMILGRLFKVIFERGAAVVATSNSSPRDLYPNGLNRQLFLPFIDMIEQRMDIVELSGEVDFRLQKLAGRQLYFSPADQAARAELDAHWLRLTGHHPPAPVTLQVKGRELKVPRASMGVARCDFAELCHQPLGAQDYLHLAHAFHTLIIDAIPQLGPEQRNEARRFINLIDTLYDNRVCLIVSAACEPAELYTAGDGAAIFERTASRLIEMRSEAYLKAHAAPGAAIGTAKP